MVNTPGLGRSTSAQDLAYAEVPIDVAIVDGVLTIDLSKGTVFSVTMDDNIDQLVIAKSLNRKANSFTLISTGNGTGYTQSWDNVLWPSGTVPTLTSSNGGLDVLTFLNRGDATEWFGFTAGQAFS